MNYAREGALRTRGGVGVVGRAVPSPAVTIATPPLMPQPPAMTDTRALSPTAPRPVSGGTEVGGRVAVPDFSGTNTQEVDVDEPDVIKTDGRRIFAVTDNTLRVVASGGGVTGTLALDGFDHRLLLRGDRLLVIAVQGRPPRTADRPPVRAAVAPVPRAPRSSPRSTSPARRR